MLTLVALVLAYDMAREMWEVREAPPTVEAYEFSRSGPGIRASAAEPRMGKSWTRLENDILI